MRGDTPRPQPALTITFPQTVPFNGLVLMPRQNHRDHEGDVHEWLIEASDDGQAWNEIQHATLGSTFAPQQVHFAQAISTRYLRLTSLSGFGADKASALADVAIMYTGPRLADENTELNYKRSRSVSADVDEAGMEEKKATRK